MPCRHAAIGLPQMIFEVQFPGGLTGAEVAERCSRDNNIHNVKVTHVGGNLTDHFNPQTMTVNLSDSVCYSSTSVAAARRRGPRVPGHAVQHARGYAMTLRSQLVPIVQFSSTAAACWVIILGLVILATTQNELLCWIGVGADRHVGGLLAGDAARRCTTPRPARWNGCRSAARCKGAQARSGERGAGLGRTHPIS